MKISKSTRGLIIVACLIAALISYVLEYTFGVGLFIAIGMIFELAFWLIVLSKSK